MCCVLCVLYKGKGNWIIDMPKWNTQRFFNNWEYTSPQTLKLECGVAEEIMQSGSHGGTSSKARTGKGTVSPSEFASGLLNDENSMKSMKSAKSFSLLSLVK